MDWHGHAILAPLTKGGNLPFRRLCVDFGAEITMSEMAYARQVNRRSRSELALLRKHESEAAQNLWRWAVVALLVMLVVESWLGSRSSSSANFQTAEAMS